MTNWLFKTLFLWVKTTNFPFKKLVVDYQGAYKFWGSFLKILFIYLFLAVLGLRFRARAFSSCGERGPLFIAVRGPLTISRPLLLRSTGSRCAGSIVVAHGPSCSAACGIFPDQGSNPCPLHWQADSQPLRHQGSPWGSFVKFVPKYFILFWCHCKWNCFLNFILGLYIASVLKYKLIFVYWSCILWLCWICLIVPVVFFFL